MHMDSNSSGSILDRGQDAVQALPVGFVAGVALLVLDSLLVTVSLNLSKWTSLLGLLSHTLCLHLLLLLDHLVELLDKLLLPFLHLESILLFCQLPLLSLLSAQGIHIGRHGTAAVGDHLRHVAGGQLLAMAKGEGNRGSLGGGILGVVDQFDSMIPDSLEGKGEGEEGEELVLEQTLHKLSKVCMGVLSLKLQLEVQTKIHAKGLAQLVFLCLQLVLRLDDLGIGTLGDRDKGGCIDVEGSSVWLHSQLDDRLCLLALLILGSFDSDMELAVLHGNLSLDGGSNMEVGVHTENQELLGEGAEDSSLGDLLVVDNWLDGEGNLAILQVIQLSLEGSLSMDDKRGLVGDVDRQTSLSSNDGMVAIQINDLNKVLG